MSSSLLSDLRKERMHSPYPEDHVFRITSHQEREIIDTSRDIGFDMLDPPKHVVSLFGCKVEVLD